MKKTTQVLILSLSFNYLLTAQTGHRETKAASTPTVITDTLHYYFNKHHFKTGAGLTQFQSFKAPSSLSDLSYCGSRFDVPAGETLTITGLEAYASRPVQGHYATPTIPLSLYLCELDNQGMPLLPPLDSISASVGEASVLTPSLVGGNFTGATVRTMTNSFAVLFRDMSLVKGDTILFLRTNGALNTSNADLKLKYSDSYGFVRYSNQFYSTSNFTSAPGFGLGTDYEFIVAPRVLYSIQAGQQVSEGILFLDDPSVPDTACTREMMTFTNTSSKFYEHRMYNLNTFYRKWSLNSPFFASPPGGFSPDSSITWHFEFYDLAVPAKDSRVFLPYANNGTITAQTDLPSYPACFTNNEFRLRLKPMGAFGKKPQYVYNEGFKMCLKYCYGDAVGFDAFNHQESSSVMPNPAEQGISVISGLQGTNTLLVYNTFGQLVHRKLTNEAKAMLDLSKQPYGAYILRIVNAGGDHKTVRIISGARE